MILPKLLDPETAHAVQPSSGCQRRLQYQMCIIVHE